jgi:cyclopropane-fatty-acyl-phospholipid synthase
LPRILWEAAKLHYGKRQPIVAKPIPDHPHTIRKSRPYLYQKIAMTLILRYFKNWKVGELEIQLPDGISRTFGDLMPSHGRSTIRVKDYRFFWRLLRDGDVGVGDSYMWGEWDTDNLPKLLGHFVENESALNGHNMALNLLGRISHKIMHLRNPNSIRGSRKNIQRHYDLSNDMYKLFLDPSMMYSCAIFTHHEESLELAQQNKVNAIIQKADIRPVHHVLEIGSGWGHFAIEAARQTGCRVTSITISEEQLKLARERVKQAGLEDRIRIELCDYRKLEGSYDRIVSIEMLEAIGEKQYETFFSVCDKSLKPGGRVVLQVITIPDERFEGHRRRVDWLQKHVFPGGLLPSLQALKDAMKRSSHLSVLDFENIGPHYVLTLAHWRKRFLEARERILELGFDETFIRKWLYYLGYCEAAFATRYVNDLQIVLSR